MKNGILCAGNWIADHILTVDRWPDVGTLCNILAETTAPGGGPCNVLFDLAAMSRKIPLHAAGRLGDDFDGEFLLREARRREIDTRLLRTADCRTSFTNVISGNGVRTFFHSRGANRFFCAEDLACDLPPARVFYLGYLLLLDALDAADPEFGTCAARLLKNMRERGMTTVVDFVTESPEKFQSSAHAALPYVDVLVINELEAGLVCGRNVRCADSTLDFHVLDSCAADLFAKGVRKWIVVHYPEGAGAWTADGGFCRIASKPVSEIAGTNGAGDAFCAGIVYGLHESLDLEEALRTAEASARSSLTSVSASDGVKSIEELRKMF